MADRRRQIELLISTRFDHLWFPSGALRTSAGLAPSKLIPCPQCGSSERFGMVAVKRAGVVVKWEPCVTCGGSTVGGKVKQGKGKIAVDPYDGRQQTIGTADTGASARPRKRVKCDGCQDADGKPTGVVKGERCPHCDGAGWRDLHRFDLRLDTASSGGSGDPLVDAIARRDQLGDWHPLEQALARIHRQINKPLRYAALTLYPKQATDLLDEVNLHERRGYDRLSSFEQALYDLAILYIDQQMPDPIRVPAGAAANLKMRREHRTKAKGRASHPTARKQRDKEIRQHAKAGRGPQWIAAEYGIHISTVYEIVNGTGAAA